MSTVIVLGGVGARRQLGGGGCREDEDVCARGVLRRVQLRRLQVQGGAAAEHGAHRHRVLSANDTKK